MLGLHGGKPKAHPLAELAGWVGAASILLAYGLALFGVINADDLWYALLNLVGAVGIVIIAVVKKVAQSIVLNVIWAIAALVAIVGIWLR